ncbi:hypothetical protein [Saccharicrinis fermentans]|uniref:Uncharacterized protein n=1 Tax=Saccharicrinis fermentans DSM 9555 = JCM 21142 TaxID=869213 RepID=W7YT23_9BACT|nr:hypothetical protein [Saccharicrinis fermentans]GAF05589.1 hypothetical protein JCM21142_104329 [Saccharicrinis fermentans DSM 9555 = JCM 21142]
MKAQDKQALKKYQEKLNLIRSGNSINPNETKTEQEERIERAKKDYGFFVITYFKHYADADCADFQIKLANRIKKNPKCRELVRWGRGLAKSVHCDILIPLWLWINDEKIYMVIVGNNYDKAETLLSDVQAEFESNPLLIHDYGDQKLVGSWTDGDFNTKDNRFKGKALGMDTSPRGLREGSQRPNLIVCDDLEDKFTSKNPKRQDDVVEWIEKDLLKTMDGPIRRYLHPNNDPWPRSIQNLLEARHPKWHLDEVKAYDQVTYKPAWHQKYDDDYYREIEEEDGSLASRAEYNHEKHTEGKIFTDDLIQWAKPPRIDHFKIIVGFWDVAYSGKNDYNAVKVWGLHGRNFWHLKAFCKQCQMVDAIRFMYDYEKEIPSNIIIHWKVESQFWNKPLKDALKLVENEKRRPLNIIIVERPRINKYDRILTMHPYYQNGRIYHNEREKGNNDMQTGISQLKGIEPKYQTHDDGPDADEQAINQLSDYIERDNFKPMTTSIEEMRSYSRNRF